MVKLVITILTLVAVLSLVSNAFAVKADFLNITDREIKSTYDIRPLTEEYCTGINDPKTIKCDIVKYITVYVVNSIKYNYYLCGERVFSLGYMKDGKQYYYVNNIVYNLSHLIHEYENSGKIDGKWFNWTLDQLKRLNRSVSINCV